MHGGKLFILISLLCVFACAPSLKQTQSEERADADRKQEQRIRDLERQLILLKAKEAKGELATAETTPVPALPVMSLDPMAIERENPGEVVFEGGFEAENFEVVGVDSDGTQIVYAGEALEESPKKKSFKEKKATSTRVRRTVPKQTYSSVEKELKKVEERNKRLRRKPQQKKKVAVRSTPVIPVVQKKVSSSKRGADASPKEEYKALLSALRAGEHSEAIAGFRAFVDRHPQSTLADNAQYWLAEAYYDQKQFGVALREFGKVLSLFPKGNKVPDAMLKSAFCLISMKEQERAQGTLKQILSQFPKSNAAQIAAQRLESIQE